ncbi:MAG: benzoate transporter, partial [Halomonas sp.]|nr:benzoate transporter [Halomonas sp.]
LFAFLIAASGIQILGIGATFWALVLGVVVSAIFETKDFEFIFTREVVTKSG